MTKLFIVRTSDRTSFRGCRRKWNWSSSHGGNLTGYETVLPLWTGTGFHFALQDFHSYKNHLNASSAFCAFADAWGKSDSELPIGWEGDRDMAIAMLNYYEHHWLNGRDPLKTYYIDDIPQVEVKGLIKLPWEKGKHGIDEVCYQFTFDRIAIDEFGRLWIVEYKTAKQVEWRHLATDQQTTSYCWAAGQWYDKPIAGVVYQQHKKTIPEGPKVLATGRLSLNKQQVTSHRLYRDALLRQYGVPENFTPEYNEFLWHLSSTESEHRDAFIQRDLVERNEHQIYAESIKMLLELEEMTNPDLALYPNPTRMCGYCDFESVCVSMDDGSDWEFELKETTVERSEGDESWQQHL